MNLSSLFLKRLNGETRFDPTDHLSAVLHHLRCLLNTRKGSCIARPDYGLSSPVDLMSGSTHGKAALAQEICQAIRDFEPRLVCVRVMPRMDHGLGVVCFDVVAQLVIERVRRSVELETRVGVDGRIEVSS